MKKITITACLILVIISCQAQEKNRKVKLLIGGNLTYNFEDFTHKSDYLSNPNPTYIKWVAGINLYNSFSIGLSQEYYPEVLMEFEGSSRLIQTKSRSRTMLFRFQSQIKHNFYYFVEPYIGKTKYEEIDDFHDAKEWNTGINFGLMYFFLKQLSVEINLLEASYYERTRKDRFSEQKKDKEFIMLYDIVRPNIGIRIYL